RAAAALLALAASATSCGGGDWGEPAPFSATPAPATWEEPAEPPAPAPDTAAEAKGHALLEHVYGEDPWPCTGHPSCDEGSPRDGTLAVSVGDFEYLDPNLITETEGAFIAENVFEGLLMAPRRSGLPPEPGVATGYELADDGKTYTFHLRADARWSDGRPVTAGDFVYSWLRALDPATGSVTVETLYYLENAEKFNKGALTDRDLVGVHAPDDHTLVVRLERPTPFWIALVTHSQYYPVPRWAIEEHGRQWTRPENIVTNGAYRVVEQRPRERVVLERSPTYWDAANVRIPRIVARSSTSENQDITLYDSGQIQYARMGVPPAELTARMTSGEPDLIIDQRLCYYQYTFNTEHPPFDDERVRRAIVMAIDKDRLVGSVTRGREVPADGVVLDYFVDAMGYPDPEGLPFDVAAARKLLAEAGFPGGKGLPPVTLSYNTLDRHQAIAEFVQRQLKENLNFDVTLENMEFKSLLKKVRAKDFDITRRGWCGEEHPYTMLEIFRSTSPRNPSGWKSAEFDSLLERSLDEPTTAGQMKLLAQAEAILQREAPFVPLFYYSYPYLKKPVLRGLEAELTASHPVKYMWWGDEDTPPEAHALVVDTPETRAAAKAPEPAAPKLLEHIYGREESWPCTGHPTCEEASPKDGMLGVDIHEPEFIDPSLVSETEGFLIDNAIFEGLVSRPPRSGMPFEPGVAESWETSADGTVYTFHLRGDARWSNGRPVVAGDFVYAWRRKLDPATASTAVEPLFVLKNAKALNDGTLKDPTQLGAEAVDDRTLRVKLEAPNRFFIGAITTGHFLPVPREAIEAHDKAWTRPENIVVNGPFTLTEWKPRERVVLTKRPEYWNAARVRLPGVILYSGESQSTNLTRYETGTVQWARDAVSSGLVGDYIRSGRPDLFIDPYLCYYAYFARVDKPPLDDARVRRALDMAIDKEGLVKKVLGGLQVPADGPMLPHFEVTSGYPKPHTPGFDPAGARQLLADAGYPGGKGFPKLQLVYNTNESHKAIAEYTARNIEENLGIRVELTNVEWQSLLKKLRTGDFELGRFGWCGDEDPQSLMSVLLSYHPENSMGYANPEFDRLVTTAMRTLDEGEQMRLYAEAEKVVQHDMPMIPMYYYTRVYLKKPVLQGIEAELTNVHLFQYMYWADKAAAGTEATP
ncbi:MAG: peptide ABC transporter substrate-binding protein, partial [Myxococcales bacterium]|nr:peptide ABC transporter substrate-binding protein [Myxococcales bacterium]